MGSPFGLSRSRRDWPAQMCFTQPAFESASQETHAVAAAKAIFVRPLRGSKSRRALISRSIGGAPGSRAAGISRRDRKDVNRYLQRKRSCVKRQKVIASAF